MKIFKLFLIIFVWKCKQLYCSMVVDYFWRDYTGEIPFDAFVAGKDINGRNIYVGQAYVRNAGLIGAQITPGVQHVIVTFQGIKTVDKYIKILCGPQDKFYWMNANSTNLYLDLIGKHAVIGGHQDDAGYISIGRTNYGGEVRIGKISSFNVGNSKLFINFNRIEKSITSYEILMYAVKGQKKSLVTL